jgi:LmbE family N-acetylglucosaminyl deacetylase
MLRLELPRDAGRPLSVLCIGAHSDDIEIGCGGTVLDLAAGRPTRFHWVVLSAPGERRKEAQRAAEGFLARAAERTIVLREFRDGFFPYQGGEIKEFFEVLKTQVAPDLVLTHCRDDLHQDHRLVNELTWNTFRDHLILEFEIPKFDGDLGRPNVYVPLSRATAEAKARALLEYFGGQRGKHWFTEETFLALLRLRGVEARAPGGYAEAFYGRKLPLRFSGADPAPA